MNKMNASRRALLISLFALATLSIAQSAHAQYSFFALNPCRVVDTRNPNGVNGGPALTGGQTRSFSIRGNCGVPTSAKAVSLNVTITGATSDGWLTLWPSGQTQPNTSTINFSVSDSALANGAIVGLSTNTQDLSVFGVASSDHVILDVTGYFQ